MNTTIIAFVMVTWQVFLVLYAGTNETIEVALPEFKQPDISIPGIGGCNWLTLCTNVVADGLIAIGAAVIWFAQLIFNVILFVIDILVFLATVSFSGIEGAPWFVNLLVNLPFAIGTVVILYRMVRKGDSADV